MVISVDTDRTVYSLLDNQEELCVAVNDVLFSYPFTQGRMLPRKWGIAILFYLVMCPSCAKRSNRWHENCPINATCCLRPQGMKIEEKRPSFTDDNERLWRGHLCQVDEYTCVSKKRVRSSRRKEEYSSTLFDPDLVTACFVLLAHTRETFRSNDLWTVNTKWARKRDVLSLDVLLHYLPSL